MIFIIAPTVTHGDESERPLVADLLVPAVVVRWNSSELRSSLELLLVLWVLQQQSCLKVPLLS